MTIADRDLFPSEAVKTEGMWKMSSLSITKDGILKDFHTFCFLFRHQMCPLPTW